MSNSLNPSIHTLEQVAVEARRRANTAYLLDQPRAALEQDAATLEKRAQTARRALNSAKCR